MQNMDGAEFIIIAPILSIVFVLYLFFKELFTPRERKTWWQRVKRRHLVREVNPDDEMF